MSNNPFRRKTSADPSSPAPALPTSGSAFLSSSLSFDAPPESTPRPPFTTFKTAVSEQEDRDEEPVQTRPKKIVKKVRVQSPPPSSPEDTAPVRTYAPDDYSDDSSSNDPREDERQVDPFNSGLPELGANPLDNEPPLPRPPPNSFSKTLRDSEHGTQGHSGGKGALDVDSFKRLLLTGYANIPAPTGGSVGAGTSSSQLPTPSNTDASSISRQSIFDAIQETPRASHEVSEPEEPEERRSTLSSSPLSTNQSTSSRKKPPPPSSRHGKLIKIELGADSNPNITRKDSAPISIDTSSPTLTPGRKSSVLSLSQSASPPSSSDINKPLPLPPSRTAAEEEIVSPFDREAAGKLPESFAELTTTPRPPTPPLGTTTRARSGSQTSTLTTSSAHRRPAAPPPRRPGHGRADSKPPSIIAHPADEDPPRSSLESDRSRADSLIVNFGTDKSLAAPAPPPPRRPNHGRQGSSVTSPAAASFTSLSSPGASDDGRSPTGMGFNSLEQSSLGAMATVTTSKDGLPKLSPPPPPPARHMSTRRPPSVHSIETGPGTPRKVSREKQGGGIAPPPPPPPRARGTSRGSSGGAEVIAPETGLKRIGIEVQKVDEESAPAADEEFPKTEARDVDDIMKQIEALQREVEMARRVSGPDA
ncbi:hypothetical protein BJ170DRAFT_594903 [Xylariales sp. AK1849]|nr:hypothetical protein BJ170DRAFT_594903 [Xylariales sp. AK1849]